MKVIGTKYQTYENEKLKIYRVVEQISSHHYLIIDNDGKEKTIREQELIDKYIKLIPDAFMNIMITDKEEYPDVYVCVNKASSLEANIMIPDLILRQSLLFNDIHDTFKTNTITFGMCITTQTTGTNLSEYMEFKNIEYSMSIALYIDDNIDDIFKILDKTTGLEKVNNMLKYIKTKYGNNTEMFSVLGYADNLKELMQDNEFIPRFRELFNVTTLNWQIILGKESYDKDGNIILNKKQIESLSSILRCIIKPLIILKYDKDIDISKIVAFKHIIVSDSDNNMYLIAYKEIANPEIINNNTDVISAMMKNK